MAGLLDEPHRDPIWGFHEPTLAAAKGAEEVIKQTATAMADPRNMWMGLGPLAGMSLFKRGTSIGMEQLKQMGIEGGYRETTRMLRRTMPEANQMNMPDERQFRNLYINRMIDANLFSTAIDAGEPTALSLLHENPELGSLVKKTLTGLDELDAIKSKTMNSMSGGSVPPAWFKIKPDDIAGPNARPNVRR